MIDTNYDFTTDSKGYWDGFWNRNDGLGCGGSDPDSRSSTLKEYHRILWSKQLPNGEYINLENEKAPGYLSWNSFDFSSDSITKKLPPIAATLSNAKNSSMLFRSIPPVGINLICGNGAARALSACSPP